MSEATKKIRAFFNSNTNKSVTHRSSAFEEVGYTVPDGDRVPDEYLVRITSQLRHRVTVIAPLQKDISIGVESRWGPAVPTDLFRSLDQLLQGASFGRASIITKATSRRMWYGSTPIQMKLQLTFQAVRDPFQEVVEPVRILQSLALPAMSLQTAEESVYWDPRKEFPILAPPGPTPFTPEGVLREGGKFNAWIEKHLQSLAGGDEIMVEIGRYLTFPSVVVTSVSCQTPVAFGPDGSPVRADVQVSFETYEMMTVEDLKEVYKNTVPATSSGSEEGTQNG